MTFTQRIAFIPNLVSFTGWKTLGCLQSKWDTLYVNEQKLSRNDDGVRAYSTSSIQFTVELKPLKQWHLVRNFAFSQKRCVCHIEWRLCRCWKTKASPTLMIAKIIITSKWYHCHLVLLRFVSSSMSDWTQLCNSYELKIGEFNGSKNEAYKL